MTPNEEFSSSQEQANTVFKLQLRPLEDPDGFKPSVQVGLELGLPGARGCTLHITATWCNVHLGNTHQETPQQHVSADDRCESYMP